MLRSFDIAPDINVSPVSNDEVVRMKGCPDCEGRGWFCLNPFAPYNKKYKQCPTCIDAKRHYEKHGVLPEDIEKALTNVQN